MVVCVCTLRSKIQHENFSIPSRKLEIDPIVRILMRVVKFAIGVRVILADNLLGIIQIPLAAHGRPTAVEASDERRGGSSRFTPIPYT